MSQIDTPRPPFAVMREQPLEEPHLRKVWFVAQADDGTFHADGPLYDAVFDTTASGQMPIDMNVLAVWLEEHLHEAVAASWLEQPSVLRRHDHR